MNPAMRFLSFCFFLFLVANGTAHAAQSSLPPMARQTLHKAQILIESKQYETAATTIQQYMETTKETVHEEVFLYLGGLLYQAGDKQRAAQVFREGHTAFPQNALLCKNLGVSLYELKRHAEAGLFLEKSYELAKKPDPNVLHQAGTAYYMAGKYAEAARAMVRLVDQSPQPKKDWIKLALHAMLEAGQFRKAESMLRKFLAANPEEAGYWRLLARIHMDREEYAKAAAALEVAHHMATPSTQDLERLASLYQYVDAPLMAANALTRAYGAVPNRDQSAKIAALYAASGRVEQAVKYMNQHSNDPSLGLAKGKLFFNSRRFTKAETEFTKLLSAESAPEARFYLALCAWERKDWKLAQEKLESLVGLPAYHSKVSGYRAALEDLESVRKEILR